MNCCRWISLIMWTLLSACNSTPVPDNLPPVEIDFTDKGVQPPPTPSKKSSSALYLAISAMTSPRETYHYYEELVHYISTKLDRPIKIEQRKTYKEVNDLLESGQIEAAFICSGAYVEARRQFPLKILAVPVIRGKPFYNAYVIVRRSSAVSKFEDLQGKSFAFTDPLSQTGRFYAEKRIAELGSNSEAFFSKIIYTHAHDYSIQAVSRGIVDGATVDGLIYDYLARYYPEKVGNVKIVEVSEDYGMPPVVVPAHIPPELEQQLREILFEMNKDPEGERILKRLMIDRFVAGRDEDYNSIREILKIVSR